VTRYHVYLEIASDGHNPPYHCHRNGDEALPDPTPLTITGMPPGIMPGIQLNQACAH
jgi:hypothetical protein